MIKKYKASVKVTVRSKPIIDVGADQIIYPGEMAGLNATDGINYNWFPSSSLSNPNVSNPVAKPLETTTYYVMATSADGCTGVDSVVVLVLESECIIVPTAFAPEGSAENQKFKVFAREILTSYSIKVYNRWGNKCLSLMTSIIAGMVLIKVNYSQLEPTCILFKQRVQGEMILKRPVMSLF